MEKRQEYGQKLEEKIRSIETNQMTWDEVANKITETAEEVVGMKETSKNKRPDNPVIKEMSRQQKAERTQQTQRSRLIEIVSTFLEEDEIRMILSIIKHNATNKD